MSEPLSPWGEAELRAEEIHEAMQRVDRAAGKILDRNAKYGGAFLCDDEDKENDELLRASLSLLNKMRRQ